mmetsp:Transcript_4769/g.17347  ORF Transcript_4769/g.17347 Transcript_4769/m.17347 type:complete len:219 (-) Transcript_4769:78-734(-)
MYCPCDVTKFKDLENLLHQSCKPYGHVSIWVNNAGIQSETRHRPFSNKAMMDTVRENVQKILSINLQAVIEGSKLAIRHMKDHGHGGSVINMSSLSAFIPLSNAPVYSATKAGVNQFTRAAGLHLGPENPIKVHAICPGFVDTPLISDMRQMIEHEVGEKLISADEIASAALELISPKDPNMQNGSIMKVYMKDGKLIKEVFDFPGAFRGKKVLFKDL